MASGFPMKSESQFIFLGLMPCISTKWLLLSSQAYQNKSHNLYIWYEKTCFCPMRTTKQQISAFVLRCLDSIIPLASVAEQVGLNLTWSKISEDRFSHDEAHMVYIFRLCILITKDWNAFDLDLCPSRSDTVLFAVVLYEPRLEKTCLQGLRPGETQTGLLGFRSQLESWIFGYSK